MSYYLKSMFVAIVVRKCPNCNLTSEYALNSEKETVLCHWCCFGFEVKA
jgi:hypothetical protein